MRLLPAWTMRLQLITSNPYQKSSRFPCSVDFSFSSGTPRYTSYFFFFLPRAAKGCFTVRSGKKKIFSYCLLYRPFLILPSAPGNTYWETKPFIFADSQPSVVWSSSLALSEEILLAIKSCLIPPSCRAQRVTLFCWEIGTMIAYF